MQSLITGERVNLTAGDGASPEAYYSYNGYAWSPSDKFVAYLRVGPWLGAWPDTPLSPAAHAQIVIAAPDGSAHPVVMDLAPSPNGIFGLEYSPDGRYLMFVSDRENNGCWNIHLLSLANQTLSRLEGVCYTIRTALPAWSSDSRWLVFTAGWAGGVPAQDGNAGRAQELTAIDVARALQDPGHVVPVRLTQWLGDDLSPRWQP